MSSSSSSGSSRMQRRLSREKRPVALAAPNSSAPACLCRLPTAASWMGRKAAAVRPTRMGCRERTNGGKAWAFDGRAGQGRAGHTRRVHRGMHAQARFLSRMHHVLTVCMRDPGRCRCADRQQAVARPRGASRSKANAARQSRAEQRSAAQRAPRLLARTGPDRFLP